MSFKRKSLIHIVTDVYQHPTNSCYDVVNIGGYVYVAFKTDPYVSRWTIGNYAIVFLEDSIIPEHLLKNLELWDAKNLVGKLFGEYRNTVKPNNVFGVISEVVLCAVDWYHEPIYYFVDAPYNRASGRLSIPALGIARSYFEIRDENNQQLFNIIGTDFADILEIS